MKIIRLIFILSWLVFCIKSYANAQLTICLTGKVQLTLSNYKSAFLNGANLALNESVLKKDIQLKSYFFDNKPLSAITAYNAMINDHCSAIIGFEYLSDLMLIAKIQKHTKIPIFTSYASTNDADALPKNTFIFSPSYNFLAKNMIRFLLEKSYDLNKILIITERSRLDLEKYKLAYKEQLDLNHITYDEFDFVGNDKRLTSNLETYLNGKSYNFVLVLSGAIGSTKVLNLMNNQKTVFIGTENFGSSTNQSVFVRLTNKEIPAFIIRNIDFLKTNLALHDFSIKYQKIFNIKPSPLSAYAYDAIKIVTNTLDKHENITTDNVLNTKYIGITGVLLGNGKFHRSTESVILSIKKTGFNYEK